MKPEHPDFVEAHETWNANIKAMKDYIEKRRYLIIEDGAKNSEILSGRSRLIALAVLGTCWALLVGKVSVDTNRSMHELSAVRLFWPMVLSVLALLFDLLQYVMYYLSIDTHLNAMKVFTHADMESLHAKLEKDQGWKPDESEGLNNGAKFLFEVKILFSIVSACLFVIVVLAAFYL
jgi:hypothetical protein